MGSDHMGAFRWFLAARTISLLGTNIAPLALAFAVLQNGGTKTDVGVLLAVRLLPFLALVLLGGALADRFSRSTVLKVSYLGAGAAQAVFAVLRLTGTFHLGAFIVLQGVGGAMSAFTQPAARGVVPQLVPPDRLQKATSLLGGVRKGAMLLGPIVGAASAATVGGGWAIAFDAATHLGYATTSVAGAVIYVIAALAPVPLLFAERDPAREPERQRA